MELLMAIINRIWKLELLKIKRVRRSAREALEKSCLTVGARALKIPTAVTMEDKLNLTSDPQFAIISPKQGHATSPVHLFAIG